MLVLPRAVKHLEKKKSKIQANFAHRGFARERSKNLQWMSFAVLKYYHVCH